MDIFYLCAFIIIFGVLGLGITISKKITANFLLLPVIGFSALIGFAYTISALFNTPGGLAVGYAGILLLASVLFRISSITTAIKSSIHPVNYKQSILILLIPLITILLPALMTGFKYFYGNVNYDFFYNSQDSWYLSNHSVFSYAYKKSEAIFPLIDSSGGQGRFAISLIAAFFLRWFHIDVVCFNSTLINTVIVLFGFTMAAFCREIFKLTHIKLYLGVFAAITSAALVQAYTYYLLGQLSALPLLVLYLICLKRYLDKLNIAPRTELIKDAFVLALILNCLYIFYAIFSIFALVTTVLTTLFFYERHTDKKIWFSMINVALLFLIIYAFIRMFIFSESIEGLFSWIGLSKRVASSNFLLIFSEYIKFSYLGLLFGIFNYPISNSIIDLSQTYQTVILMIGFTSLIIFLFAFVHFIRSTLIERSSRSIVVALSFILLFVSFYLFLSFSPYGVFKIRSYFMPLLIPIFVFGIDKKLIIKNFTISFGYLCSLVLLGNMFVSSIYLYDFLIQDNLKHNVNVRGITGNKDIDDLTHYLNNHQIKKVSLLLTNGIEAAWIGNKIRDIDVKNITHNFQPLADVEYQEEPPIPFQGLLITKNPSSTDNEITDTFKSSGIVYQNNSYTIIDPKQLESVMYLGRGSYPLEFSHGYPGLPNKFRWVEETVSLYIYHNKKRRGNLNIELAPGFVKTDNTVRHVIVSLHGKNYPFEFSNKTTLTIPNIKFSKGLTLVTIKCPDKVLDVHKYITPELAKNRKALPNDFRILNFAIGHVGIS